MYARWAARFLSADGSANSRELLVDMTQTIKRTFKHVARHEKGIQDAVRTLTLARGSCRDLAVLMIAALRSLGIAARFVSGYLHLADDVDDRAGGGNTHAWVQVYVPGPGWVDFDPSTGMVGNQNLVRVAVVHEPHEAIPLQGTWIGSASDHVAMMVAVKVATAAAKAGVGRADGYALITGAMRRATGTAGGLQIGFGYFTPVAPPPPVGHNDHFSFNITNLHTHGLHTAPQGPKEPGRNKAQFESDNVLVELRPGEQQEYRIHIHDYQK